MSEQIMDNAGPDAECHRAGWVSPTASSADATHPSVLRSGSSTAMTRWLSDVVLKWRAGNRRSRFPPGFDDHMLRDIDLTRLDVIYPEFTKPISR
jgi:hypothetical protein